MTLCGVIWQSQHFFNYAFNKINHPQTSKNSFVSRVCSTPEP